MTNLTQQRCGNFHAPGSTYKAYVPCWPFDGEMCDCGDLSVGWGPVRSFAWDVLIGWWWDGAVLVRNGPG